MRKGNLFVVSGPSGSGKGTLVSRLLEEVPDAWVSVSATTRQPRDGEVEGVHYFFKTEDEFRQLVEADGFLEWARYSGNCYGTPRASVEERMREGRQVVLEIDMQGGFQIREKMPEAVLVFIEPPSLEELRRRLEGRGTETTEQIQKRMEAAELELARKMEYDVRLVNDDLETAVEELVALVNEHAENLRGQ